MAAWSRMVGGLVAIVLVGLAVDDGRNTSGVGDCARWVETSSAELARARALIAHGRTADAEVAARAALRGAESACGSASTQVGEALNILVEALWRGGKAKDPATRPLAERAVRQEGEARGEDSPEFAECLSNLGVVLQLGGERDAARALHERALAIQERRLGAESAAVARSLVYLGSLLADSDRHAEARPLLERAVAIQERAVGPPSPDLAMGLNVLANLHYSQGDYARARPLYGRALAIREKALGPAHPLVAGSLNNLAGLLYSAGDFVGARENYERALRIREQSLDPAHPQLATSLNNLGLVLRATGDYAAARPYYERSVAILEKAYGPEDATTGSALDNLGELLSAMGDATAASAALERALAIQEKALGPHHTEVAITMRDLAVVRRAQGDSAAARRLCEGAVHIQEEILGAQHPQVARTLEQLADLHDAAGRLSNARALHERTLVIRKAALGDRHPEVGVTLSALSSVLARSGQTAAAFAAAHDAEAIGREHVQLTSRALAEREALRYDAVRTSSLDLILDLAAAPAAPPRRQQQAWDAVMRSRAVVLDEIASRRRRTGDPDDAATLQLGRELRAARDRLANLTVRGSEGGDAARYRTLLEAARADKERAERALAQRSAAFRRQIEARAVGFAEVAAALPAGSVLVAYAFGHRPPAAATPARASRRAQLEDQEGEAAGRYVVFVLGTGRRARMVEVGAARDVEPLIERWIDEVARGAERPGRTPAQAEAACRSAGEALRHVVWDPVAADLRGARRVFIVPDAALHWVDFAALPAAAGRYLIETAPLIHYLSTERDVVAPSRAEPGAGLLAMGGPDFDAATPAATAAHEVAFGDGDAGAGPADAAFARGGLSPCADYASIRFPPLPASADEVQRIAALWSAARPDAARAARAGREGGGPASDVACLTGAQADEAAFKQLAPGRRSLHLATHGFFLGGPCDGAPGGSRGFARLEGRRDPALASFARDNPLLLSGLAFAGANRKRTGPDAGEDGILTAEEIAGLDLRGVELAVLSACNTGLGQVSAGEGVFGLRRAFRIAGVQTLIMSLWPVRDALTKDWMQALYEKRLVERLGAAEAVRTASLDRLDRRRAQGLGGHPFYWAGFICAGAPG